MLAFENRDAVWDWLFGTRLLGPIGVNTNDVGRVIVVPQTPTKTSPYAMLWSFPEAKWVEGEC